MPVKRSANERNPQDGFILVTALIAVMILIALGIFALTTSTQDVKAVARSVSEGNALSAAEAGVQTLCSQFNPNNTATYTNSLTPSTQIYIQNFTNAEFSYTLPQVTATAPAPGNDITVTNNWQYQVYNTQVTGYDNLWGGSVTLNIGIMNPTPVPGSPNN